MVHHPQEDLLAHAVPNDLMKDLIALQAGLVTVLLAMDINSGISAAPGANAALISAYLATSEIILHKYSVLPVEDIIYDTGISVTEHGLPPDLRKLFLIEDTVP